ncbi:MAG: hypothetical protein U1D67_03485 [Dehalococcoidia bacterium]|nr:hypothetical protein [Dehalococcoidia bacterium]
MYINWNEYYLALKPLALFVMGMVVYSVFVFNFYRFLGRRDIFKLKFKETYGWFRKFFSVVQYIIKYRLLVPFVVFVGSGCLSVLLMVLAKNQNAPGILLISVALVATVRITAYYHEDLSKDLAKILPFALLGIFLVDVNYFQLSTSLEIVKQIPGYLQIIGYYLAFIVALEFLLRIVSFIIPGRK